MTLKQQPESDVEWNEDKWKCLLANNT